jgi:chloride channel 7
MLIQGIYDMHVQLTGLPMLSWAPPPLSHNVQTKQIMSTPVVVMRPIEKVSTIMEVLESCPHQGFPVVDDRFISQGRHPTYGILRGLILRSQLKILLCEKAFCTQTGATLRPQVSLDTFRKAYPRYPALKVNFASHCLP